MVLVEFYASPPGVEEWEEDILVEDVLEPGDSVDVTIADGSEDCTYDFLAVFETDEGEPLEVAHASIEVCEGQTYSYRQ